MRNKQGSGAIEIVAGFIFVTVIVFVFLDILLLLEGSAINDEIARDAAHAASAGPPGILAKGDHVLAKNQAPYIRASAVVESRRAKLSTPFELANTLDVRETLDPPIPSELFGGPVIGTVTVGTTMLIHPKFVLGFFKLDTISIPTAKTFPYSWIMKSAMDNKVEKTH